MSAQAGVTEAGISGHGVPGLASPQASLLAALTAVFSMPPHGRPSGCVCVLIASRENTSRTDLGHPNNLILT